MPTAANSSHAGATCHITFPGTNNYFCSSCGYSSNGFWMALSSVSPQVLTCSTSFAKCEVFQTFSDIIAEMSTRCCVDCLWVALYQFLFRLLWWCVLNKHFFFDKDKWKIFHSSNEWNKVSLHSWVQTSVPWRWWQGCTYNMWCQ